MTPAKAQLAIECAIEANIPAMLWGPVGVGKSSMTAELARSRQWSLRDIRLSQFDSVDLRGIPSKDGDRTVWNIPSFLPDGDKEPNGIIFLDEINQAAPSVAAAAYQLVLDRKLGDYELPPGWRIIAAGNRASDRALTNKMSSALSNRLIHIDYEPNLQDWVTWANANKVRTEIVSFLRFRPEMLFAHEPNQDARAFPTPRTWDYASKILDTVTKELEFEMLEATIGKAAAGEFMSYIRIYRDLPDIEQVIKAPDVTPVPSEPASLYAIAGMLSEHATEKNIAPRVDLLETHP